MKLDSKYFDAIRVKPEVDQARQTGQPGCQMRGCNAAGLYKAPKGRGREGEYFVFCLAHVRDYNKRYNYFNGMSDDEVVEYQKDALTGHRPTWEVGANSWAHGQHSGGHQEGTGKRPGGFHPGFATFDPFGVFGEPASDHEQVDTPRRRPVRNIERKCLRALGLDDDASPDQIKTRFKDLVKRHHPDMNGGDRSAEDKLREVIQAYNYLKEVGLC